MKKANSQSFTGQFINMYRQHTALWKVKSKSYKDKKLKEIGYNELLRLFKTVDVNANIYTVKKKINNIRSSFKKEESRIKKSIMRGGPTYEPTLWYYDKLLFINDQEETRRSDEDEDDHFDEENDTRDEKSSVKIKYEQVSSPEEFESIATSSRSPTAFSPTPTRRKRAKLDETEKNEEMPRKYDHQFDEVEDEFDTTGKYIANKLRNLSQNQRMFAEIIIMDVLYEAQLGTLHRRSKLNVNKRKN